MNSWSKCPRPYSLETSYRITPIPRPHFHRPNAQAGLQQTLQNAKPPCPPSQRLGIVGLHLGFSSLISRQIPSGAAALSPQPDKFAVIDRKTVITGSFNWSPSAAHQNDEMLLVIRSPQVAAHFSREMYRLWRSADLGITERLRRKLERNRQRCGSGIQRVLRRTKWLREWLSVREMTATGGHRHGKQPIAAKV